MDSWVATVRMHANEVLCWDISIQYFMSLSKVPQGVKI